MPGPRQAKQVSANGLDALMKRYSEVQLATLVDTPPEGAQWLHEIKFDGYRLLGYVFGGASRLLTRNGKNWTNKPCTAKSGCRVSLRPTNRRFVIAGTYSAKVWRCLPK